MRRVGLAGTMCSHSSTFHAAVIEGRQEHREPGKKDVTNLESGSYSSATGETVHQVLCGVGGGTQTAIREACPQIWKWLKLVLSVGAKIRVAGSLSHFVGSASGHISGPLWPK
jgi:hypothetical protein